MFYTVTVFFDWGSEEVGTFTDLADAMATATATVEEVWSEGGRVYLDALTEASGAVVTTLALTPSHAARDARAVEADSTWLDADDMPPVVGSTGWMTEATFGRDDGTGRRCGYADRQFNRSLRRHWRSLRAAYCR